MRYLSTRGLAPLHSFSEAVEAGLAPDGGLFLPGTLPDLRPYLPQWAGLGYAELAAEFFILFAPEIPAAEWHRLTRQAYARFEVPEVAPLLKITDHTRVLELFHGPTLAFKDFALQLLGLLYKRQVALTGRHLAVLGATSGDTGSAAIHGCLGQPGITIFILYPDGKIAPLQERQMACTGAANVFAIPVPGTFDDAQRVVKDCFGDTEFSREVNLSAVNSINIARVLAQCVYYLYAWLRLPEEIREKAEFAVPTGNFGNILAGWLVRQMGVPTGGFRVATNHNDILHRFFTTGIYEQGTVQPSHAPSMDIQAASNFERFLWFLLGRDPARLRAVMQEMRETGRADLRPLPAGIFRASRMDDPGIAATISRVHRETGYLCDPHTACAFPGPEDDRDTVVLATAHPAKFPSVIEAAAGVHPVHPSLEALKSLPLVRHPLPADPAPVKDFIRRTLGAARL